MIENAANQAGLEAVKSVAYLSLPFAVIALVLFIKNVIDSQQNEELEKLFPEFLKGLSKRLKSGMALESAVDDITKLEDNVITMELKMSIGQRKSFDESLAAFASKFRSRMLKKTVDLIVAAHQSGSSLSEILDRVAEEFWSIYLVKKEKSDRTGESAAMIFANGAILSPLMLGMIQGIFLNNFYMIFVVFMLALAVISTMFYGLLKDDMLTAILLLPVSICLAAVSFVAPIMVNFMLAAS